MNFVVVSARFDLIHSGSGSLCYRSENFVTYWKKRKVKVDDTLEATK